MAIMAYYLSPNTVVSVEEQRQLFQIISKENPLHSNKRKFTRKLDAVGLIEYIRHMTGDTGHMTFDRW